MRAYIEYIFEVAFQLSGRLEATLGERPNGWKLGQIRLENSNCGLNVCRVNIRRHFVSAKLNRPHYTDYISLSILDRELVGDKPSSRDTFILLRGQYDKPGEKVIAATPASLPPMPTNALLNRLGLARWLVSAENPLTARVIANRFWQQIFGTGLIKTSEDFGAKGEPPSHPELLDWLANEFVRSGWDVKHLMRLVITIATYRQRSNLTTQILERDSGNRLLARGPRVRLAGEFVRDQALAVSGLFVPKLGVPPVRPYHPAGLYETMAPTSPDTVKTYIQDKGESLYRRSLYTYWKRSIPHPAMLAFGTPFRETCT